MNAAGDRWIVERRGPRVALDAWRPAGFFSEEECGESGELATVATVLLANRECPFRCAMCDLWRHTLEETVPAGAIPAQIDFALARLPRARVFKLYNSGSFFDARAIPREDLPAVAARAEGFERVIVECHPAFVGGECARFAERLRGRFEVAIGLETAHPETLAALNKRMTLRDFELSATFLRACGIGLRVFILVRPPFLAASLAAEWTQRSVEMAFACGAGAVSLIPARAGNGALEVLAERGLFTQPRLEELEAAHAAALGLGAGRVFADLWDLERFSDCTVCFSNRRDRLHAMNLQQTVLPPIACAACG